MVQVLEGIKNFLQLINDNWTLIVVIIGLLIALYRKIKSYLKKSNDEKIQLAWDTISKTMLAMVSEAESNYLGWKEAGSIKRAEVIDRIFVQFPILEMVTNRDEVIAKIDNLIDEALVTMREIFEKNQPQLEGGTITESEVE